MSQFKFDCRAAEAEHWKSRVDQLRRELEEMGATVAAGGALKFKRLHIRSLVRAVKELTGEDY